MSGCGYLEEKIALSPHERMNVVQKLCRTVCLWEQTDYRVSTILQAQSPRLSPTCSLPPDSKNGLCVKLFQGTSIKAQPILLTRLAMHLNFGWMACSLLPTTIHIPANINVEFHLTGISVHVAKGIVSFGTSTGSQAGWTEEKGTWNNDRMNRRRNNTASPSARANNKQTSQSVQRR